MKFKECLFEIIKNGVAVHCDTEEKAKVLLKELAKYDIRWPDGTDLTEHTCWKFYENQTCYRSEGPLILYITSCMACSSYKQKVLEFEELLEDEQENDNNNNDNLVIKVNDIIHDLIDYANKKCESTIHTAEAYKDGYIKGCKNSLGEIRAILSEIKSNGRKE